MYPNGEFHPQVHCQSEENLLCSQTMEHHGDSQIVKAVEDRGIEHCSGSKKGVQDGQEREKLTRASHDIAIIEGHTSHGRLMSMVLLDNI